MVGATRRARAWIGAAVGVVTLVSAASVGGIALSASPATVAVVADSVGGHTALETLATLAVKGRAPKTGYDRDQFGTRWLDVDRNGCDTRNDMLARDLTEVQRSGSCRVLAGVLADPYTGSVVAFTRGQGTSERVQIDHVVALSNAWQTGAQQLSAERRAALANDPLNLLAVDGGANAQKSDGDAATWLPKNRAFRCAYVARQVSVKAAYGLWVTPSEHDAIARVLTDCPNEPAPTPLSPTAPSPAPQAGVVFATCVAARSAGAAPLRAGDPGYSLRLDGDRDGVACETP